MGGNSFTGLWEPVLMGLQVRNHIYDPSKPLLLMADTSALESSMVIFQWDQAALDLQITYTKSILLTTASRRRKFWCTVSTQIGLALSVPVNRSSKFSVQGCK